MATQAEIDSALGKVLPHFGVTEMKKQQKEILKCLLANRDCVATLPTGFGKSLAFQTYIPVRRVLDSTHGGKMIVCCPLVSLMHDQVDKLSSIPDIAAAYRGFSESSDKRIQEGSVDIIYASPETLVGDPLWRTALQKLKVDVIVIDEFHTIATWGYGSDGTEKEAFRKWFAHIGELRSLFPDAYILALSATCTTKIRKRVLKVLSLKENTDVINMSPNKTNIKLVVAKVPNTVEIAMFWLVDGLRDLRNRFPRTVMYCQTIRDVTRMYTYITEEQPDLVKQVDMFHSHTPQDKKMEILQGLKDTSSSLRLVVCTSALGMGVDIAGFDSVIIYGNPGNTVDLVQEIGRVGRGGDMAIALLLYNSFHLRKSDTEVRNVYQLTECRRMSLMTSFLTVKQLDELKPETGCHSCCDICAKACSCGKCSMLKLEELFAGLKPILSDSSDNSASTDLYYTSDSGGESDF